MTTHNVSAALNLLKVLADEVDRDTTLTIPMVFLRVAQADRAAGVDYGQVMRELKISSSSMTRTVQTLGDTHYGKEKTGLGLVKKEFDPSDNRLRLLKLTPKGERFAQKIFK